MARRGRQDIRGQLVHRAVSGPVTHDFLPALSTAGRLEPGRRSPPAYDAHVGIPIICKHCTPEVKNSLLHIECRRCGRPLSDLVILDPRTGPVRSAEWETRSIPDLWREADVVRRDDVTYDVHTFLEYTLLLRAVQEAFDQEDKSTWFDDALFFLTGGYDFFSHLNRTSDMTLRARIFGGLGRIRTGVAVQQGDPKGADVGI